MLGDALMSPRSHRDSWFTSGSNLNLNSHPLHLTLSYITSSSNGASFKMLALVCVRVRVLVRACVLVHISLPQYKCGDQRKTLESWLSSHHVHFRDLTQFSGKHFYLLAPN